MRVVTGAATHDGIDALAGDAGIGEGQVLTATLEGPGTLSFWWRCYGQAHVDRLRLEAVSQAGLAVEGSFTRQWKITGIAPWTQQSVTLPPGRCVLTWNQKRTGVVLPEPNGVWLDEFSFTPSGGAVSVAEAVDSSAPVWTVEGDASWLGLKSGTGDEDYGLFTRTGATAAKLHAAMPPGWFTLKLSGDNQLTLPQTIQFSQTEILTGSWRRYSGRLPAGGTITIQPNGPGMAVDEAAVWPDDLTAGEALDAPQISWTLGPSAGAWGLTRVPQAASDGVDAAVPLSAGTGWIEGVFPGPGELKVKVNGTSSTTLNGQTVQNSSSGASWTEQRWALPPGSVTMRWNGGAVDDVRFAPWQMVTPEEALDTTALTWSGLIAPPGGWYGVNDAEAARDGADLLRQNYGTGRAAVATWNGPGALRWWWKGNASLSLDDTIISSINTPEWRAGYVEVEAGAHAARFTGSGEMDEFSWQANASPWRTALENPAGLVAGDGDSLWSVATVASAAGGTALASPALKGGQSARLRFHATGPGTLRFAWRGAPDIASRTALGLMELNGTDTCNLAGATAWREHKVSLDPGENFVEWTAFPWSSEGCAAGALLLDNVRVEQTGAPVSLPAAAVEALGLSGQPVALTGAVRAVVTPPEAAHDGVAALRVELPASGSPVNAQLDTVVSGPFELSFWRQTGSNGMILFVDGVERMVCAQPGTAALLHSPWRLAVATVLTPGPHTLSFRGRVSSSQPLLLDELQFSAPGAPGTFGAAAGNPALEWIVPDLGAGHALPDPAAPRGTSAGAKLGAGAAPFHFRAPGPIILSGWFRQDIPGGSTGISNSFGGYAAQCRASGDWQPFRVAVPAPAPQSIAFLMSNLSGAPPEAVWLDSVTAEPWREASISEAMGSLSLNWTAAPAALWKTTHSLSERRVFYDSTVTAPLPELSVELSGPGFLLSGASPAMQFFFDGAATEKSAFLAVPAGAHTARWTVPGPVTAGAAFLDGPARMVSSGGVTSAAALDLDESPALELVTAPAQFTGIADWELSLDGRDCGVWPGLTSTTEPVEMVFSVTGPGRAVLAAQSRAADAVLSVELDGTPADQSRRLTSLNWQWFEAAVPAGVHELKLLAVRGTPDGPLPHVLLDRMRFDSDAAAVSAAGIALDAPGQVWLERAARPFAIHAESSRTGGSAARTAPVAPGDYTWLETQVNGPGLVSLWAFSSNATALTSPDAAIEAVWGSNRITLTGPVRFRVNEAGPLTLRVTFRNGWPGAEGMGAWRWFNMDAFQFLPDSAPSMDLGEAVDAPALTWSSADGHWRGVDLGLYGDLALAEGGATAITRTLGLTLPAAGTLSWRWRRDGARELSFFNARENQSYDTFSGNSGSWISGSQFCLPQQRQWEFRGVNLTAGEVAQLDQVVWTPATTVTPEEAVETPGRTWTASAPGAWVGLVLPAGDARNEDDALVTGPLDHNQSAWIQTVVTPPAFVGFDWKLSAEAGDVLRFSVNGSIVSTRSGTGINSSWSSVSRHLTGTAPVTLRWTYAKNEATHGGRDTAWLDNVTVTAMPAGSLPAAANVSGLTLTAGGNAGYSFLPLTTPLALTDGSSAAFFGQSPLPNPPSPQQAWLDGTVTGPGVLTLAWKGTFEMLVDNVLTNPPSGEMRFTIERDGWTRVWRVFRDNAPHQIRIRCNSSGSLTAPHMVDEIRFDALAPLAAAELPGLTLSTDAPEWDSFGDATRRFLLAPLITSGASHAEAAVTGPALLTFTAGGHGSLVLDGVTVTAINGDSSGGGYFGQALFVPPGAHTVRWYCTGSERLWLSGVGLSPAPDPWLPALLDAPALWMMSAAPQAYARGTDTPLEPGNPYAVWDTADPPLEVFLPGAGHLEASWSPIMADAAAGTPQLSLTPGSPVLLCPGVDEYVTSLSNQLFTSRAVRLALQPWSATAGDVLRVDRVRFVPAGILTAEAALDSEVMAGAVMQGWRAALDAVQSYDAEDAAIAEVGPTQLSASLSANVEGPGTLTFWWKKSSAVKLVLAVDGVVFTDEPNTDWRCQRLELRPGTHSLAWTASTDFTVGSALLDHFTFTRETPFLNHVSPHVPALFTRDDSLSVVTQQGVTGLLRNDPSTTTTTEILVTGPSLTDSPDPAGKLIPQSGPVRRTLSVPGSGVPLTAWPVWPLAPVSLAEGLDTSLPVTSSVGWAGGGVDDFDFIWLRQPAGAPAQWIETTVQGPGWLTWNRPLSTGTQLPVGLSINGAAVTPPDASGPAALRLSEAIPCTVRWTAPAPANGETVYGMDRLTWAPDTPETHPAAWLADFGLNGADAQLDADPDQDGRNNLMEFALGGDPSRSDSAVGITPLIVARDGSDFPAITFRGRNLSRLIYRLQRQANHSPAGWLDDSGGPYLPLTGPGPIYERQLASSQPLPQQIAERSPVLLRLQVIWVP